MSASGLLAGLADVGRDPRRGGYSRPVFSTAEGELRDWFAQETRRRGLELETDRNGGLWAWRDLAGGDRSGAVVTGSHLDSVPGGGSFDGPLGVVSALAAFDLLDESGHRPSRPLAAVVFPEEEGSRFGLACLGSGRCRRSSSCTSSRAGRWSTWASRSRSAPASWGTGSGGSRSAARATTPGPP